MSGMDFRENWLRNFRAIVDMETARAGGNKVAGRTMVAQNLEKGEQTIYQHYEQKSGKVYPTVEMMVLLEKKYGDGRPGGWAALPESFPALAAQKITIEGALQAIADLLQQAEPAARDVVAGMLANLARAPGMHFRIATGMDALLKAQPRGAISGEISSDSDPLNQRAA